MMAEHGREKASPAGAFGRTSRRTFDLSWTERCGHRTQLCGEELWDVSLGEDYYRMLSKFNKITVWAV